MPLFNISDSKRMSTSVLSSHPYLSPFHLAIIHNLPALILFAMQIFLCFYLWYCGVYLLSWCLFLFCCCSEIIPSLLLFYPRVVLKLFLLCYFLFQRCSDYVLLLLFKYSCFVLILLGFFSWFLLYMFFFCSYFAPMLFLFCYFFIP